jgi:hypothetical protein
MKAKSSELNCEMNWPVCLDSLLPTCSDRWQKKRFFQFKSMIFEKRRFAFLLWRSCVDPSQQLGLVTSLAEQQSDYERQLASERAAVASLREELKAPPFGLCTCGVDD